MATTEDTATSLLGEVERAIRRAEEAMDLIDVDDDAVDEWYDIRHHCGTCQVRTVLEIVWPPVQRYIDFLHSMLGIDPEYPPDEIPGVRNEH